MEGEALGNLTLRHVRLFLEAARFENFSTAARHMYMTQPMVSRIIAGMEESLGIRLFYRINRRVKLTPAGQTLAAAWEGLIQAAEKGVKRARDVQEQQRQHIAIGNDSIADKDLYFFPITTEYIRRFPNVELDIEHGTTWENIEKLRHEQLDLVYAMLYDAPGLDEPDLTWKLLQESPLIAYVPPGQALYTRERLDPQDLEGQTILLLSDKVRSGYTATVRAFLHRCGIGREKWRYLPSVYSINYNLFQGKGIFIGNRFMQLQHKEVFRAFPLEGSRDGLIAVWRQADTRSSLLDFVQIAGTFFEQT